MEEMKLAIVGTSHLTKIEKILAECLIEGILGHNTPELVITGDADGIDSIVRQTKRCPVKVWKALDKKWGGKYGFKERNMAIAEEADKVISITTKTKDEECYHCNARHQRTGGCWTLKYAKSIGKKGEVILLQRK